MNWFTDEFEIVVVVVDVVDDDNDDDVDEGEIVLRESCDVMDAFVVDGGDDDDDDDDNDVKGIEFDETLDELMRGVVVEDFDDVVVFIELVDLMAPPLDVVVGVIFCVHTHNTFWNWPHAQPKPPLILFELPHAPLFVVKLQLPQLALFVPTTFMPVIHRFDASVALPNSLAGKYSGRLPAPLNISALERAMMFCSVSTKHDTSLRSKRSSIVVTLSIIHARYSFVLSATEIRMSGSADGATAAAWQIESANGKPPAPPLNASLDVTNASRHCWATQKQILFSTCHVESDKLYFFLFLALYLWWFV
jgi:hypothetical protein